ncbi:THUMP-like domain-containing protein [Pseudofulvibacter geojedonensis]|uniref:Class I SAM-dependent methyltransferase n=1 Tax=Pseudofulvibacter geojedonensis TaxID=1123758 RepID=A0ABW3I3F8_9FLAO
MNKHILNPDFQYFIIKNLNTDISSLLLKKQLFDEISQQELVEQIEAKKKCQKKLPTWFSTPNIFYPNKLNIEQTSSEITAEFKANLIEGKSLIDLTGGLGVDDYYFSKKVNQITHCEINEKLSKITQHNFKQLGVNNITFISGDGLEYLKNTNQKFDWIYIDPSRRHNHKGKVFLLEDCLPNVPENLDFLFSKTDQLLIKNSPILDITNTIKSINHIQQIHIVAVKNEVKELLIILKKGYEGHIEIISSNLGTNQPNFCFSFQNQQKPVFSTIKKYLYEPNSAIMKSGGFNEICCQFNVSKLHQHSHLYTSDNLQMFPGRSFEVIDIFPYQKKNLKKRFGKQQFNITTRNFPKSVVEIRKESSIKEGGKQYIFFTTDIADNKIVILCNKI